MTYEFVGWQEEGLWAARSPSIPGYGVGETRGQAEQDLSEAIEELIAYLDKPEK